MKKLTLCLAAGFLLIAAPETFAQEGNGKKGKKEKEYKEKENKGKQEYKERYKDKEYGEGGGNDRYERRSGTLGDILGRVVFPPKGVYAPRRLEGVPKGHYPPPGECRIWYPNRPPGHQPPPTDCRNLMGVRLEPGAFILHGDRAYDAEYDWREEERRRPGSVTRDILDILFPSR
ncbi:hypothetical protein [Sabulibacter ruber]|uniref:hypothetical protein n=1 Tax=Sabulibacter ruber TaxID=2811901 RepID=UPI001A97ABB7|nr:hypothetical protein [Sabulibacter ruber]